MQPIDFIQKWSKSKLNEQSGAQQHFLDLCQILGEPTPSDADPSGTDYAFERGVTKITGGRGRADVWKRGHFAWEYKGHGADLNEALKQLQQYAPALDNPPLLIVSDMMRIRITTAWTNLVTEEHNFELDDLADGAVRQKLKWAMSDPDRLRPTKTRFALTKHAADTFAQLALSLRGQGHDAEEVAQFVNRCVFCMFAEDVELLPKDLFTRMLEHSLSQPEEFAPIASDLFRAMSTGGRVGIEPVKWFNGGLFADDKALPMNKAQIEKTLEAAKLDWSEIDPSILGTLFERGLDPSKREQLGAHYTDRIQIMQIIDPVIKDPWLAEWKVEKARIADLLQRANSAQTDRTQRRNEREARNRLNAFLDRLRRFTVLDPACGSGNFLYLALLTLHDLEHQVRQEAESLGLQPWFPVISPANVRGIEINQFAADLARVSVWIGELQWMRKNGFAGHKDPILGTLETIECRDAILTPDGQESEWPKVDAVIGNPPFLGNKRLRPVLGEDYIDDLYRVYDGRLPNGADLVCYWFTKAGESIRGGNTKRVGLVATNSIRGGANRVALERAVVDNRIFNAWSKQTWPIDGANVDVALVCFAAKDDTSVSGCWLDDEKVREINSDLTASVDLTKAVRLPQNARVAYQGDIKGTGFEIPGDLAREWLLEPANPNGQPNADVITPWINGDDITGRPADMWIIDFGVSMMKQAAALYESPFQYALEHVQPPWEKSTSKHKRDHWWIHTAPRKAMRDALQTLTRCIATPRVAKHRLFVWMDCRILPSSAVAIFAREEDMMLGILQSRFHVAWALRKGTFLQDRPRYVHTDCFNQFPFPTGLTPDIPASDLEDHPHAYAIASAAKQLVDYRDKWLNPPELVEWVDEPVPGYPKRVVPVNDKAAKILKGRTLTNLYNQQPTWLINAHKQLDDAVAAAYGWPSDIDEETALRNLLELNLQRGT